MKFGIYNTDGEYQRGDLKEYSDLAIALDTSTVALYLKINDTKVILGTSVNLHIGRSDTLLFIGEENLNTLNGETIRNFFSTAISEFEKQGYSIENIANDKELLEKLKKIPFKIFISKESAFQPAQYITAKLILNEPVYVVSRDSFDSISIIVEIIKILQGNLSPSPGFVFVSSRKTFKATDISILPGKPSTIDIEDVNLDTCRIINTRDIDKYQTIYNQFLSYAKKIPGKDTSRIEFLQNIIHEVFKNISSFPEKRTWISFAQKHKITIEYTAKDIVNAMIEGDQSLLTSYLPLSESKTRDLFQEINSLRPEKQDVFLQKAGVILKEDKDGLEILKDFSYDRAIKAIKSVLIPQQNLLELQKYIQSKIFYPDIFKKALLNLKKEDLDLFISTSEKILKSCPEVWAIILELRPPSATNAIQSILRGSSLELESYLKFNSNKNEFYTELSKLSENDLSYFIDAADAILSRYPPVRDLVHEVKKRKLQQKRAATVKKVSSLVPIKKLILPLFIVLIIVILGLLITTPELPFIGNNPIHSHFLSPDPIPTQIPPSETPTNTPPSKDNRLFADFNYAINITNPRIVDFTYISPNSSNNTPPIKLNWNFGDGNTSDLKNPIHEYPDTRKYNVSLNVSYSEGFDQKLMTLKTL